MSEDLNLVLKGEYKSIFETICSLFFERTGFSKEKYTAGIMGERIERIKEKVFNTLTSIYTKAINSKEDISLLTNRRLFLDLYDDVNERLNFLFLEVLNRQGRRHAKSFDGRS